MSLSFSFDRKCWAFIDAWCELYRPTVWLGVSCYCFSCTVAYVCIMLIEISIEVKTIYFFYSCHILTFLILKTSFFHCKNVSMSVTQNNILLMIFCIVCCVTRNKRWPVQHCKVIKIMHRSIYWKKYKHRHTDYYIVIEYIEKLSFCVGRWWPVLSRFKMSYFISPRFKIVSLTFQKIFLWRFLSVRHGASC